MQAFGLKQEYQIEYKSWMRSSHFTVNATYPEGATDADLPIMIQHLLEDRFALVYHRETRQLEGYALEVTKSGPKLERSALRDPNSSSASLPNIVIKNGTPQFTKDSGSGKLMTLTNSMWRGRNKTMKDLASDLAGRLGVPVADDTGLEGEYNYSLTFATDARSAETQTGASGYQLLPDALQDQLGLKLRPIKNVRTEVVVLDNARKEPTEN